MDRSGMGTTPLTSAFLFAVGFSAGFAMPFYLWILVAIVMANSAT